MTDEAANAGWFAGVEPGGDGAREAIRNGSAAEPDAWPERAVEAGVVDSEDDYYEWLHEATVAATREAVRERERADDRQLVHAIRTVDDLASEVNELAERHAEWAGSLFEGSGSGVEYARSVAGRETATPVEERVVSLAERVVDLAEEREATRAFIERQAPAVAPNLAALAGPVLAARLVELAGGLEALAKMPSGTVQVLGAEDALFAHLRGHAPSPKHGVIFTHEYVRGTRQEDRGSAARALAGKLTIAARIDHYSGDRRPELEAELDERIAAIRARADAGDGGESDD
ncbi:NOP5/NOP56 family protein [Halocalculus aciditolerans]|uniref:Nucleolar n=1 Tax=Halocalculus aciditolerans TaxID=1383812 RepID=A0A830FA31_9EURY|nr:NOP5/NOP56 family protein [Halocalculus aciditolerans]GGL54698.1 nucleolar [Halocalculus aciditolerans]